MDWSNNVVSSCLDIGKHFALQDAANNRATRLSLLSCYFLE